MTTFREFLADVIREHFAIPRSTPAIQATAASWQRHLPTNLTRLPGYKPGQYVKRYHNALEQAIYAATTPQHTDAIALSDIQQAPHKENTANPVDNSLILWHDGDEDATERMPIVRKLKTNDMNDTKEVPALEKLSWFLQAPIHKQGTGEQEKLPEAFLL